MRKQIVGDLVALEMFLNADDLKIEMSNLTIGFRFSISRGDRARRKNLYSFESFRKREETLNILEEVLLDVSERGMEQAEKKGSDVYDFLHPCGRQEADPSRVLLSRQLVSAIVRALSETDKLETWEVLDLVA